LPEGASAWVPIGGPKSAVSEEAAAALETLQRENAELKTKVEILETRMASLENLTMGKAAEN
ncbi:MAG: hypothetical protein KC978_23440, partial [Candidatus Omnitrophica bacterium]|nr:hypothetical protein [Candidatus Omnitrophota bacterium]